MALIGRHRIHDAESRAGRLLIEQWDAVDAVARALVERAWLNGDDVRRIIGRCQTSATTQSRENRSRVAA